MIAIYEEYIVDSVSVCFPTLLKRVEAGLIKVTASSVGSIRDWDVLGTL